jgi:branched-chain amino acid transport system substrate-binding protein
MKRRKIIFLLMAFILILGSFAGCGGGTNDVVDNDDGDDDAGDVVNEVKVGINYELSGEVATYGQSCKDGIIMAFDEINEAGGVNGMKLVAVIQDNKSDPAEATSLATKLITQGNVVACLGPATSGNFMATIPVAMQNGVPVISASATADEGVTTDAAGNVNEYVFRLCFNDSFQGVTMASFALGNLNAKNAVIIQDKSSDYAEGLARNFTDTFEAGGGSIVAHEGYVSKDRDFKSILTSIKGKNFDVIFLPGYYQEAGLVIKQARELGIDAPILGADGFDSPVLLELAGEDALNDVYFSNHYSSLDEDPMVKNFIEDFGAIYNAEPNAFHALGYDLGRFIADAIGRAETVDGEGVKNALASTKGFVGGTGSFDMGPDHNPIKAAVVIGLVDGEQASSVKVEPK